MHARALIGNVCGIHLDFGLEMTTKRHPWSLMNKASFQTEYHLYLENDIRNQYPNNLSYVFNTDFNVSYFVEFKPSSYIFNNFEKDYFEFVYEFVISVLEKPDSKIPVDPRISDTVASIFYDFFEKNHNHVAIFICDSADRKQEIRMKKFQQWFYKYQDSSLLKMDEILIDENEIRYPISIIIKKQNPYFVEILSAFAEISNNKNE